MVTKTENGLVSLNGINISDQESIAKLGAICLEYGKFWNEKFKNSD
jgi:hypothetical protein